MILNSEKHRKMLIQLLNSTQFNGSAIEDIYELKKAIEEAEVKED